MKISNSFIIIVIAILISGCITEDVIRSEDGISFVNATSINSSGLTPNSGNNITLISEMNNGDWTGNETNAVSWSINITFQNVTSFSSIDITSRYFSTSGTPSNHEVELMIFCTIHNEFMELKDYHNEDHWYSRTYFIADPQHYITSSGNVTLQILHTPNGVNTHRMWIDVARLIVDN